MSRPIVVIACMPGSSESWELQQHPHLWHSRAGGGAVHSIKSRPRSMSVSCPLCPNDEDANRHKCAENNLQHSYSLDGTLIGVSLATRPIWKHSRNRSPLMSTVPCWSKSIVS